MVPYLMKYGAPGPPKRSLGRPMCPNVEPSALPRVGRDGVKWSGDGVGYYHHIKTTTCHSPTNPLEVGGSAPHIYPPYLVQR